MSSSLPTASGTLAPIAPPRKLRPAGAVAVAGLIYLLLTVLAYLPDSLALFSKWMVWFEDPTNAYRIWWFSEIIWGGREGSIWFTPLLNYPDGMRVMWSSNGLGKELLAALLGGGAKPWLAMNLISFTTPLLVGMVVFAVLYRRLRGMFAPALLGGWLGAWTGTFVVHAVNPWVASMEGLAWFVAIVLLMRRGSTPGRVLLAGTAAALAIWLQIQMLIYVVGIALIFVVDRSAQGRWRAAACMAGAGAVAVLLTAPLLVEVYRAYGTDIGAMAGETATNDYFIYRNRLTTLLLPTDTSAAYPYSTWNLLGWLTTLLTNWGLPTHSGSSGYLGWVVLVLAFLGWRSKLPGTGFLAAVWLIFVLLSLGPVISIGPEPQAPGGPQFGATWIPGPFALVQQVPPFSLMRTPLRFVAVSQLVGGLLAAYGFAWLTRGRWLRSRPALQLALAGALMLVHTADHRVPNRFAPSQYTPFWEEIAAEPGMFAILDIPYLRGGVHYMHYGAYHQKGVLWAFASRGPQDALTRREQDLMFPMVVTILPENWPTDYDRFARGLVRHQVRYIIVHKLHLELDFAQPQLGDMARAMLAILDDPATWRDQDWVEPPRLCYEDAVVRAYRVEHRQPREAASPQDHQGGP